MICPNPVGNSMDVNIHPAHEHWHGKVSISHLRTLKHCRHIVLQFAYIISHCIPISFCL